MYPIPSVHTDEETYYAYGTSYGMSAFLSNVYLEGVHGKLINYSLSVEVAVFTKQPSWTQFILRHQIVLS